MRKRKGEELLKLIVTNTCAPLTRAPAPRHTDTHATENEVHL
jgi:hypothetical protein